MKVCFFSPTAYGYFNPEREKWAGGAESQQFLLAAHMVDRGLEVSFIVGDHGQPDVEIHGGITVIKSFTPFAGNRKLRFAPDMLKIKRAMEIADADVYNQRSTSFYTGQLVYFAKRLGRKFTFSVGIDYNCYPDCQGHLSFPMTALYRYGIKSADAVIAQTEKQRALLRRHMGRDSVLIRNGIPINCRPVPASVRSPYRIGEGESEDGMLEEKKLSEDHGGRPEFLWVGSFRRRKRPELFLELAKRIPGAIFTIVGGGGDDPEYARDIAAAASRIENVSFPGYVEPDAIEKYYSRAYAYVNTSVLEGFPNTYLHSWRRGVPTYTIEIDPDGIIAGNGIGVRTGSFEGLVAEIAKIAQDPAARRGMSARAMAYVASNHDIREKGDEYIGLFEKLLRK